MATMIEFRLHVCQIKRPLINILLKVMAQDKTDPYTTNTGRSYGFIGNFSPWVVFGQEGRFSSCNTVRMK